MKNFMASFIVLVFISPIILLIVCSFYQAFTGALSENDLYMDINQIVERIDNGSFEFVELKTTLEGKHTREVKYLVYKNAEGIYREMKIEVNTYYKLKEKYEKVGE